MIGIVARHFHQLLMKDIEATFYALDDNGDFQVCFRTSNFNYCKYFLENLMCWLSLNQHGIIC